MHYKHSERSNLGVERKRITLSEELLSRIFVIIWLRFKLTLRLFCHEVGADERIDVSVHDAVHITGAELGAVVFDHPVRLHDVGANLAAEGDVQLALVEFVGMRLALLNLEVVQARAKHLHGDLTVLALAAFRLATHHYVGWQVSDANRGLDLVYVLPAFAAGAEGVDAEVFRSNVNFDAVVNFRDHKD